MTCSFRPRALIATLLAVATTGGSSVAAVKAKAATDAPKPAFADTLFEGLELALDRPLPRRPRHRGGRRARPAARLLHGRDRRRRLEDDERRHRAGQPVTDGRFGPARSARSRWRQSDPNVVYVGMGESCIRGNVSHGDGVYRSTDAGQDLDARRPRATRSRSAASASTRRTPTSSTSRRSATSAGPNEERGVFRSTDGGETLGEGALRRRRRRAPSTSRWTRPTRASSTRRFWQVAAHAVEPGERRPGQRRSGRSTDGGDTWKKLDGEGPAEGPAGARSASPSPPPDRERVCAIDRGRGRRRLPLRRRRRRPGRARTTSASCGSAPGTTRTSTPTRRSPTPSTSSTCSFYRSMDGGKTFDDDPRRRTATTTTSGSTRTTRCA